MANEARNNAEPKGLFDSSLWQHAENLAAGVAEAVAKGLECDEVHVTLARSEPNSRQHPQPQSASYTPFRHHATASGANPLFCLLDNAIKYGEITVPAPLTVNDLSRARLPGDLATALGTLGVKSFGVFRLMQEERTIGLVTCFYTRGFHRWRNDEVLALQRLGDALPRQQLSTVQVKTTEAVQQTLVERYQRLATHGNIVILTTDRDFSVVDVFGNTDELLGVTSDKLKGNPAVWGEIVDQRDAPRLIRRIKRLRTDRTELEEEVRIVHQRSGRNRWVLLRALPYHNENGELLGWEGFGLDVTDRREAQDALVRQNSRLHALYEVSKAVGEIHDPAMVTLTGLRAVVQATASEAGYAVFCGSDNQLPEVVAAIGLSEEYLASIDEVLLGPSLLREALESQKRFLIPDMQADPRAAKRLAEIERIRAAIIIPLLFEDAVYGAIVLFKRSPDSYDNQDFELAVSAASQITLAIRQSEMLEVQRRQSASLGSLYAVSKELAKYRASIDFSEHILPTLRQEFALKRCWVGLTNAQGTFVVGRAGFGPEVSNETISTQIEISDDQPLLQEVLHSRAPLVLDSLAEESPEALLGLFRDPGSLVVVPMVTVGQTMGVLVLEPLSKNTFLSAERLQLLVSMANEMATAMMAGRFESKMANAVKMRTAGLLASGVAHNFNNILQAIIGQVSLVQLHAKGNGAVVQAGQTIQEAAMRGAALVRQLLSFATKGNSRKAAVEVAALLDDSRALYESLLGKEVQLAIDNQVLSGTAVYADQSQLQQVITGMLANAKDALAANENGEVEISAHSVMVRASELDADLSPGPYVRIDIRDNGAGMTPEEQVRCFEPFYTTKNIDRDTGVGLSGSGLGLAAAYATVKEHSGAITVHSKVGDGTIFSIYLPCCSGKGREASGGSSSTSILVQQTNNGALLLGIEPGVQPFIASALESVGYAAQGVFDLRQANEMLAHEADRWSIVIVDSEGLAASSKTVCQELLAAFPSVVVICLGSKLDTTSNSHLNSKNRLFNLEKPITAWALEAIVNRITSVPSNVS